MKQNLQSKYVGFRDIVIVTLFSVLTVIISAVTAIPFAASVYLQLYLGYALSAIICGTVYVLMISKSPKIGTQLIFFGVKGIYMMLAGHVIVGVIFIIGGLVCELIVLNGGYENPLRTGLAYMVHNTVYGMGSFFPMWLFADSYTKQLIDAGHDADSVNTMVETYNSPLIIVTVVLCLCVFSAFGAWIGVKMLKKHFQPAGVAR
ncbi:MAG: MptD family putative ECF transporter S component [Lachnospiraceae bacterium]